MRNWRVGVCVEEGKRVTGKRKNHVPRRSLASRAIEESVQTGIDAQEIWLRQDAPAAPVLEEEVERLSADESHGIAIDNQVLNGVIADDCPMCDDFFLTTTALAYIARTYDISISAEALADPKTLNPSEHRELGDVLGAIVMYTDEDCEDPLDEDVTGSNGTQGAARYHISRAECLDPLLVLEAGVYLRLKDESPVVKKTNGRIFEHPEFGSSSITEIELDSKSVFRIARRGYEIPVSDLLGEARARVDDLLYSSAHVCDCEMPAEDDVADHWHVQATGNLEGGISHLFTQYCAEVRHHDTQEFLRVSAHNNAAFRARCGDEN